MRRLYGLSEVLEMLSMSRTQAYREMSTGRLGYIQRGRHRLFEPEAIDAFIATLKQTEGVDRILELIDAEGRIDVSKLPDDVSLSDLAEARQIVTERQLTAAG